MKIAPMIVALAMAFPASAAIGQTAEDRQACMGDVMRLCTPAMPDRVRVIACILKNRSQLGSKCQAVVARYSGKPGRGPQQTDKPRIEQTVSLE